MRAFEIQSGMRFYDESNGRDILVENVSGKVAVCLVTETEWNTETDEVKEVEDAALFTTQELTHFSYKGVSA